MIENLVLEALKIGIDSRDQLHQLKIKYAKEYRKNPPKNSEIIAAYRSLLKKRKIRENHNFEKIIQ